MESDPQGWHNQGIGEFTSNRIQSPVTRNRHARLDRTRQ